MSRRSLPTPFVGLARALATCGLLALGAIGCGGGPAVSPGAHPASNPTGTPASTPASTVTVAVDGDRPGRPGCLDCVVRVCPGSGAVADLLLEVNLPADYDDVTFTWARLNVTTPDGVTHGVNLDPTMVSESPISLAPSDFSALPKGSDWQGSVSEIVVKYTDSTGFSDGETWSTVPKPGGCGL